MTTDARYEDRREMDTRAQDGRELAEDARYNEIRNQALYDAGIDIRTFHAARAAGVAVGLQMA